MNEPVLPPPAMPTQPVIGDSFDPHRLVIPVWLTVFLSVIGLASAQSPPNLSVDLNTNRKAHVVWPVPTVGAILQESSTLNNPGAWQNSTLNITTTNCNCQALEP